ncbi:hypothetical protein HGRIS_000082 [Hohenbuehelia grisea]|uniref:Translation initiation factor eIF4e n=1 Tax=Hohenbuehelia grisea TaxID=104357 RepID=A0ABR3JQ64_9AGAR
MSSSQPRMPLPSLNQLAARINPNATASSTSTPGQTNTAQAPATLTRPRLAASVLRTGSNASLATTASTTDSVAVNAPTTRSTSPTNVSGSPPRSITPVPPQEAGEPLTKEGLEKLNEENSADKATPEKKKGPPAGYKGVPSLDAITARLANVKARGLSIDGSTKPPEPEMIEDPKTPGVLSKAPEHPLQYTWTIYHDTKAKFPYPPGAAPPGAVAPNSASVPQSAASDSFPHTAEPATYEANLTVIGEFDTVESFCRYFNWLKPPSQLTPNSNYHLFKHGIKPMWEDPANANGGKWVLTMRNNPALLDRCWQWLAMALVGEELEEGGDEICGAVVSLRSKVDRIQVWTRGKDDIEKLNSIGKKLAKLLDVGEADGIGLEFQFNSDDRPPLNKFLSISALPATSYRSTFQSGGTPTTGESAHGHHHSHSLSQLNPQQQASMNQAAAAVLSAGSGAFGSFGIGIGQGGLPPGSSAWRKRP